jgi:hypothetical protein
LLKAVSSFAPIRKRFWAKVRKMDLKRSFKMASQQNAYWRKGNKKGRAEFGSAFFTYGSLNAVVLVRGHSHF